MVSCSGTPVRWMLQDGALQSLVVPDHGRPLPVQRMLGFAEDVLHGW